MLASARQDSDKWLLLASCTVLSLAWWSAARTSDSVPITEKPILALDLTFKGTTAVNKRKLTCISSAILYINGLYN